MIRIYLLVFASMLIMSGCAVTNALTASDFRNASVNSSLVVIERYQVKRSFRTVAHKVRSKANKCLRVRIKSRTRGHMQASSREVAYIPTFKMTRAHAELHVQMSFISGNVIVPGKVAPKGSFLLVADIAPKGKRYSSVVLYRPKLGHKHMTRAVKGWIDGTISGCPDLTR